MRIFPHTNRRYLDALADHVVVFDGSMGANLLARNLTAQDYGGEQTMGCVDYLVISSPHIIEDVHASFLAVGAEVVETDTFRCNRITMKEYGLQDRVLEMNRTAAQIARRVCDRFTRETGIPRFVSGSIGPSGLLPSSDDPTLGNISFAELVEVFHEQALGLIQGGSDLIIIETQQDILETKAAIHGTWRAFEETGIRIPIQAQITLDTTGRMLLGTDIAASLTTLEAIPVVDIIGMNCSTGPDYMREPIRYLTQHARKPISCIPNAGLPLNVDGKEVYPMQPVPIAEILAEFVIDLGVNAIGGCCGTLPPHIHEMVKRVQGRKAKARTRTLTPALTLPHNAAKSAGITGEGADPLPLSRSSATGEGSGMGANGVEIEYAPMISSAMRAIALRQDPPPLIVGERVNSQGSRKMKQLLLEDKYDEILSIAREQVEGGAHALDICVALTERADEALQMHKVVKKIQMSVETPLVIDSTEADVIKAALEMNPGRAIINSINLENGRKRCDDVLPLAVAHGAAVIALTIDEVGMAKTAARKVEVAQKIYDIAIGEYGLAPEALIFDDLTFTLATGDAEMASSAIETIEGIRAIKAALPGVLTSLGVSNVSFGLKAAARAALNSVFLHHCVAAGLDMALVHPKDITPYTELDAHVRQLCDDLIYNRAPDALAKFIAHFERVKVSVGKESEDPTKDMTPEQKIHWMILHRKKDGIESLIDTSITTHGVDAGATPNDGAVWTLNNVLLPAMKEVGDKFGAGELILPFVLQSAEVMKKAVAHLEKSLDRKEGQTKGKVVLATVYGDVHDIGKSLVNTILSNNGYTTFDLGKQVPANVIIDKALEVGATAIGLSALLVSTSKQMPLIVNELHKRNLNFPVLIGGAAINRKFGRRILFTESGAPYEHGVFYCKDAFEGLDVMEKLINPHSRGEFVDQIIAEAHAEKQSTNSKTQKPTTSDQLPMTSVKRLTSSNIPRPPFWGAKVIKQMPLEMVLRELDLNELYRLQWGAKNAHGEEWLKLKAEFEARLEAMKREAMRTKTLQPQAVYGYFPAQSEGDTLIVYDPSGQQSNQLAHNGTTPLRELARFEFPRQEEYERLCISDYFAPVDSGIVDVVAFQVVTVGRVSDDRFAELQARNEYSEAYFFHGLAVEAAEATAEYVHQHIKRELGLTKEQGRRYSWGYPACPDLAQHEFVFKLLPQTSELGMELTSAFQLVPEESTAAIVAHHPDAKYYSMKMSRLEQLEAEMARSR